MSSSSLRPLPQRIADHRDRDDRPPLHFEREYCRRIMQRVVRKFTSFKEEQMASRAQWAAISPSDRVAMVWQLTLQAWMFKEGSTKDRLTRRADNDEPRLRRDVVRTVRRRG
jgi:hypothetical protein